MDGLTRRTKTGPGEKHGTNGGKTGTNAGPVVPEKPGQGRDGVKSFYICPDTGPAFLPWGKDRAREKILYIQLFIYGLSLLSLLSLLSISQVIEENKSSKKCKRYSIYNFYFYIGWSIGKIPGRAVLPDQRLPWAMVAPCFAMAVAGREARV